MYQLTGQSQYELNRFLNLVNPFFERTLIFRNSKAMLKQAFRNLSAINI